MGAALKGCPDSSTIAATTVLARLLGNPFEKDRRTLCITSFCFASRVIFHLFGSERRSKMKILVISLAGIGDTLLATPLMRELRLNYPQATIDVLLMWAGARDLLEGNPHLNHVYQKNFLKERWAETLEFLRQLRRERYDVSLNTYPQSKIQYRMVTRFIGARQRLSHVYDNWMFLDDWLVNRTVPQDYALHSVENNLKLLALLCAKPMLPQHDTELFVSPAETKWAEEFVEAQRLGARKILGIHVGSGKTKNLELRRWPLENYVALIRQLISADASTAVLLFGGPEEQRDHETILARAANPFVQVAPSKNLREAAALLQRCHVFLSVDTAPMHLAAAVKVPQQLVIETPTFNKTIEPYGRPYVLIRNPMVKGRNLDYYRYDGRGIQGTPEELRQCMLSVTVEEVFSHVNKALASVSKSR